MFGAPQGSITWRVATRQSNYSTPTGYQLAEGRTIVAVDIAIDPCGGSKLPAAQTGRLLLSCFTQNVKQHIGMSSPYARSTTGPCLLP